MSEFNPYHSWLGLPIDILRPNYYQLLRVTPDDCSRETLLAAAKSQLKNLKLASSGSGQHPLIAQLAKEIEAAAKCLANNSARQQYNESLLASIASGGSSATGGDSPSSHAATCSTRSLTTNLDEGADALPMAMPVEEDAADAPSLAARVSGSTAGDLDQPSPIAADEPAIVVAHPRDYRTRRRRSIPWTAFAGLTLAALLMGAALVLVFRPDILSSLQNRPVVAHRDEGADPVPSESAVDQVQEDPLANDAPADEPTGLDPPADSSADSPPAAAIVSKPPIDDEAPMDGDSPPADSSTAQTSEPASANVTPPPPTDNSSEPAIDPLPFDSMATAVVDFYLSATLSSLAAANIDDAAEFFSRLEPMGISESRRARFEQVAAIADIHTRFLQAVRQAAQTVAGGENIDLDESRTIGIVESDPDLVVFRAEGVNVRLPYEQLPLEVALGLARRMGASQSDLRLFAATSRVLAAFSEIAQQPSPARLNEVKSELQRGQSTANSPPELSMLVAFVDSSLLPLARPPPAEGEVNESAVDAAADSIAVELAAIADDQKPFWAIEAGLSQSDPTERAACLAYAQRRAIESANVVALMAIAEQRMRDRSGSSGNVIDWLSAVPLKRWSPSTARSVLRALVHRLQFAEESDKPTLLKACDEIAEQFSLDNYRPLLQRLAGK
jgi:hypothetical protein